MQSQFLQFMNNQQEQLRKDAVANDRANALMYEISRDKKADARNAIIDERATKVFNQSQDERTRKLNVRDYASDQAKGFDAQSVRSDSLLAQTNKDVLAKYNQMTNGGTKKLTDKQMQTLNSTYTQGYNPTREEVMSTVTNRMLEHGATGAEAAQTATLLGQGFDTKASILANEAAQVKSTNLARKAAVDNAIALRKLTISETKANNSGGKSGKSSSKYPYSGGDQQKIMDSLDSFWGSADAKQAITELVKSSKISPNEAKAYVMSTHKSNSLLPNSYNVPSNRDELINDANTFISKLRANNGYGQSADNTTAVPELDANAKAALTYTPVTAMSYDELIAGRNDYKSILNRMDTPKKAVVKTQSKVVVPKKTVLETTKESVETGGSILDKLDKVTKEIDANKQISIGGLPIHSSIFTPVMSKEPIKQNVPNRTVRSTRGGHSGRNIGDAMPEYKQNAISKILDELAKGSTTNTKVSNRSDRGNYTPAPINTLDRLTSSPDKVASRSSYAAEGIAKKYPYINTETMKNVFIRLQKLNGRDPNEAELMDAYLQVQ